MKSVLISIQPKWCELIANGKKTIEVRKTKPRLETPFKVYIYCTLQGSNEFFKELKERFGEYEALSKWNRENWGIRKGKVIGEFVCDNIEIIEYNPGFYFMRHGACLKVCELWDYGKGKTLYGWHISNLVIYDKPRELSEFYVSVKDHWETYDPNKYINGCWQKPLTRPPQSWCYVKSEVITNEQI